MSWFDILKRKTQWDYASDMRARLGTAKPATPQPAQTSSGTPQQCNKCNRMKLNVKTLPDGKKICSVCEAIERKKVSEAL